MNTMHLQIMLNHAPSVTQTFANDIAHDIENEHLIEAVPLAAAWRARERS